MKNPNNLIINSLSGDWRDNDIIMLHACFQLLTDCVENEQLLTGHIDWSVDESISFWALDRAVESQVEIKNNKAIDILCYHPGYTLVEKLQTIATKIRNEQSKGSKGQLYASILRCILYIGFAGSSRFYWY